MVGKGIKGDEKMGLIRDFINSFETGIQNSLAQQVSNVPNTPKKEESHPATIQELDRLAAVIILGESIKNMHNRMVANRQHEEMMDELRRIGRE